MARGPRRRRTGWVKKNVMRRARPAVRGRSLSTYPRRGSMRGRIRGRV